MRIVSSIAGLVVLFGTLVCTSCASEDTVQVPADFNLTGTWQLRFEPPLIVKDSGGSLPAGSPEPQPHELDVRLKLERNQGNNLLGYINWQEDDMDFMVMAYPTFANNEFRAMLPSDLELVGTPRGNDLIKGDVSLLAGKTAPSDGVFKAAYKRHFRLNRTSTSAK